MKKEKINEKYLEMSIIELMENNYPELLLAKDKDIILIISGTGAGKSALIAYLNGYELEIIDDEIRYKGGVQPEKAPIIGQGYSSETLFPTLYQTNFTPYLYCDCPGFSENRNRKIQIWQSISLDLIKKFANKIRVGIVIDYNSLKVDRGAVFDQLINVLGEKMFDSDFENIKDSVFFIVTKTDGRVSKEKIVERILGNDGFVVYVKGRVCQLEKEIGYKQKAIKLAILEKTRKELEKEIEELSNKLEKAVRNAHILSLINEKNIVLSNIVDRGETKKIIENYIQELVPINKNNFSKNENTSEHVKFREDVVYKLSNEAIEVFTSHNKNIDLCNNYILKKDENDETINSYKKQKEWSKDNFQNQIFDTALLQQNKNNEVIQLKKTSLKSKNEENKQAENKIEIIESQKEQLYWESPVFEEDRIFFFGWFSWSTHVFEYPGNIAIFKYKTEAFNTGNFTLQAYDSKNGILKIKYESNWGTNGRAQVKVYVKNSDIPNNRAIINSSKTTIETNNKIIEALENDIRMLEIENSNWQKAINNAYEDFKNHLSEKLDNLKEEQENLDNNIDKIKQKIINNEKIITENMPLYKFVNEISHYLNEEHYLPSHFSNLLKEKFKIYEKNVPKIELPKKEKGRDISNEQQQLISNSNLFFKKSSHFHIHNLPWDEFNPNVYAKMCELSYFDGVKTIQQDENVNKIYTSLQLLGWTIIQHYKNANNCYYGVAFYHEQAHIAVIAHRGTVPTNANTILGDDVSLFLNKLPTQFKEGAFYFTNEILESLKKNESNCKYILHTGHSLGGSLAALCATEFGTSAVTFDPYGIKNILMKHIDMKIDDHYYETLPVISFLSSVNMINSAGNHVGLCFAINPIIQDKISFIDISVLFGRWLLQSTLPPEYKNAEGIAKILYDDFLQYHSINNIRRSFDNNTNLPSVIYLIHKWPNLTEALNYISWLKDKGQCDRLLTDNIFRNQSDKNVFKESGLIIEGYDNTKLPTKYFDKLQQNLLKKNKNIIYEDSKVQSKLDMKNNNFNLLQEKIYLNMMMNPMLRRTGLLIPIQKSKNKCLLKKMELFDKNKEILSQRWFNCIRDYPEEVKKNKRIIEQIDIYMNTKSKL